MMCNTIIPLSVNLVFCFSYRGRGKGGNKKPGNDLMTLFGEGRRGGDGKCENAKEEFYVRYTPPGVLDGKKYLCDFENTTSPPPG